MPRARGKAQVVSKERDGKIQSERAHGNDLTRTARLPPARLTSPTAGNCLTANSPLGGEPANEIPAPRSRLVASGTGPVEGPSGGPPRGTIPPWKPASGAPTGA
jgi:hypothetical protein